MKKANAKQLNMELKCLVSIRIIVCMIAAFMISLAASNVKAHATTIYTDDFVGYLNGLVGTTNSSRAGYCLKWTFEQYKAAGATEAKIGKSCNCAYEAGSYMIQSSSRDNIPRGACVFFGGPSSQGTCSCGHHYGHVGIYMGDGNVISIHGNGKIKNEKITDWDSWGYNYRGWGIPKNVELAEKPAPAPAPAPTDNGNAQATTDNGNNGNSSSISQWAKNKFSIFNKDKKSDSSSQATTTLKSVKNSSKKTLQIAWYTNSGADGFEVQAATNKKFTRNKKFQTVGCGNARSTTLKGLKRRTYYVRVRSYVVNSNGSVSYGKWSEVKKVKVR